MTMHEYYLAFFPPRSKKDLCQLHLHFNSVFRTGDTLPICEPLLYGELKITAIGNGAASICDEGYKPSNKTLRVNHNL